MSVVRSGKLKPGDCARGIRIHNLSTWTYKVQDRNLIWVCRLSLLHFCEASQHTAMYLTTATLNLLEPA